MDKEQDSEKRSRKMTEKGLEYTKEMKGKLVSSTYKKLFENYTLLERELQEYEPSVEVLEDIRNKYSGWLELYDKLFDVREHFRQLLDSEEEVFRFERACEEEDNVLAECKANVEDFILKCETLKAEAEVSRSKTSHKKSKGRALSACSGKSAVSAALLHEKQLQAELAAKAEAMKEKQQLIMEEQAVRIKQEQLELKTQLAASHAKSKVLREFETDHSTSGSSSGGQPSIGRRDIGVELNTSTHNQTSEHDDMSLFVKELRKPVPHIQKFDGNPLEFRKFLRQFKSRVIQNTISDDERMNYLEQFTVGDAHRVVKGYSYLEAEVGYKAAMSELEERYGDENTIATALIQKALRWPNIRPDDPRALDEYSIFLAECSNAVSSLSGVKVLEYPDNLRNLVMKLPYHLHDKWRNKILQLRSSRQPIVFKHLVDFVKTEAKKAIDPIFGKSALQGDKCNNTVYPRRNKPVLERPKSSFSTCVGEQNTSVQMQDSGNADMVCWYCNSNLHSFDRCNKLRLLSHADKLTFLMSKGRCFRCLQFGHISKHCNLKAKCNICSGNHQTILHIETETKSKAANACTDIDDTYPVTGGSPMEAGDSETRECTLAIVPVRVSTRNGLKIVSTYAFLDPGSTVSFCTESLIDRLGCKGKHRQITIDTMSQSQTMSTFATDDLQIYDLDMNNVVPLPQVFTKEYLPVKSRHIPTEADVRQWPHLAGISLPQINAGIDLLIGGNVADAYTPTEIRTGPSGSPHASKTRIGWIVWNMVRPSSHSQRFPCACTDFQHAQLVEQTKNLEVLVEKSFKYDFPESQNVERKEMSQEDKRFIKIAENSINMTGDQYSMKLPFKEPLTEMPDNRQQALLRLKSLRRKFTSDPKFYDDYCAFMDDIINKGYAEEVPESELDGPPGRQWYIPHHGVYHPHKPDKIRVVFDCSATHQGVSLNNVLLQGPNLANNLVDVLLKFRQEEVAVMGDIESMFYRVKVKSEDTDFQRFYWWPNGNYTQSPKVYRMRVHMFGTVSSPSCASFALRQTAKDNRGNFNDETCDVIESKFYVDDCLFSKDTEDAAIDLVTDVTALCKKGGFRLTKWCSNNLAVLQSVPQEERAKDVKCLNLDRDPLPNERALGVFWFVESDMFGFKVNLRLKPNTRRGILSVVSGVYDPLGYVGPFVLVGKQILQKLCKSGIGWDEQVAEDTQRCWNQWTDSLPDLEQVRLPRCYKPFGFGTITSCQLHVFADASELGYGIVIYLRLTNSNDDVHCALVMSKSRVTPLKKVTIPRLELTAATAAVKLSKVVESGLEIHIDEISYWTDSMSVLRYISNESSRFKTFVANRITVIRDYSDLGQWRHLPSKLNPADVASRGTSLQKLLLNKQWFDGPDFLYKPESMWPQTTETPSVQTDDPEMKKPVCFASLNTSEDQGLDRLIGHFSSWKRLTKAVGWMYLFIQHLKLKKTKETPDVHLCLTTETIEKAKMIIVRHVQSKFFQSELQQLQNQNCQKVNKSSPLSKLSPMLVDGVLRVGGRLTRADIEYDAKHPIILPKKCHVSEMILHDIHKDVGHLGRNAMLSRLRTQYWILGAGVTIKRIVSKCATCRKYQAPACQQKMADFPEDRVTASEPPFTNVGMDYFGPFQIKRGRVMVKRYGVVFTCLSMRAVHLEVAHSLDTDSCINAIRRFISRRGSPKVIRSDNGTNLVGAERELREQISSLDQDRFHSSMLRKGVNWIFNPPMASHFGGAWERVIRSVRKVLYSIMQEQIVRVDDEGLSTLLCEVEAILNGRPLTPTSSDPHDLEPLTPNHLLLLRSGENSPPGLFNRDDTYSRKRWKHVQYLADIFWKRWTKEYLTQMQMRHKWTSPKRNLKRDDIVLLIDNTPRHAWALARVLEVTKDKGGLVRTVKVKTAESELVRPVSKLSLILESPEVEN